MATIDGKMVDLHRELLGLGVERLISKARGDPKPVKLASVPVPAGPLAEKATKLAYDSMDEVLFNHSLRTFFFGAIAATDQFPDWHWDAETFYLASILHDLGLTIPSIDKTVLSFEFDGALQARDFLLNNGADKTKADIVFEAIARHTDLVEDGKRPEATLVSIGAGLDIGGMFVPLVHQDSLRDVVAKYPLLDLPTSGPVVLQYEVDKKNHQCHAKYLMDMGITHMFANNPLVKIAQG